MTLQHSWLWEERAAVREDNAIKRRRREKPHRVNHQTHRQTNADYAHGQVKHLSVKEYEALKASRR